MCRFAAVVLAAVFVQGVSGFRLGQHLGHPRAPPFNRCQSPQPSTSIVGVVPGRHLAVSAAQYPSLHLDAVEAAVDATLAAAEATLSQRSIADRAATIPVPKNPSSQGTATRSASNVLGLPEARREAYGAARVLRHKLDKMARGGDCRRCWLKPQHCVCASCPPLVLGVPTDTAAAFVESDAVIDALPETASASVSHAGSASAVDETSEAAAESGASFPVRRLFVLMHHKEVGLAVDTAKLLLAAYPNVARLAVGGLGGHLEEASGDLIQSSERLGDDDSNKAAAAAAAAAAREGERRGRGDTSMDLASRASVQGEGLQPAYRELVGALVDSNNRALVLFPSPDARPFAEVAAEAAATTTNTAAKAAANKYEQVVSGASQLVNESGDHDEETTWDVVVIDGTWEQARKLHARLLIHVAEAQRVRQERTQRHAHHRGEGHGGALSGAPRPSSSSSPSVQMPPQEAAARVTHVCLSDAAVAALGVKAAGSGQDEPAGAATEASASGLQLRRHPTRWRQVRCDDEKLSLCSYRSSILCSTSVAQSTISSLSLSPTRFAKFEPSV